MVSVLAGIIKVVLESIAYANSRSGFPVANRSQLLACLKRECYNRHGLKSRRKKEEKRKTICKARKF